MNDFALGMLAGIVATVVLFMGLAVATAKRKSPVMGNGFTGTTADGMRFVNGLVVGHDKTPPCEPYQPNPLKPGNRTMFDD